MKYNQSIPLAFSLHIYPSVRLNSFEIVPFFIHWTKCVLVAFFSIRNVISLLFALKRSAFSFELVGYSKRKCNSESSASLCFWHVAMVDSNSCFVFKWSTSSVYWILYKTLALLKGWNVGNSERNPFCVISIGKWMSRMRFRSFYRFQHYTVFKWSFKCVSDF